MVYIDESCFLQSQPGKQIRIVFFVAQQNNFPGLEPHSKGHHVDRMTGVQGKDDFFLGTGIDELGYIRP